MALAVPFLSVGPRIRKERGRLIATTSWYHRIITLGLVLRKVIIDPDRKLVVIRNRYAWFFTGTTKVPFRFVKAITYGYHDVNPEGWWAWTHDSADVFKVGLKLIDLERVHLFRFYGEGTFTNNGPMPDWMYWPEYLFDVAGDQESQSRAFVELLAKMIAVTIEP
jgi:hypothetical protein